MNDFWLKTKAWTKLITFSIISLYIAIFLFLNRAAEVQPGIDLVFKKYQSPNILIVLFVTSLLSVITWWLIRTALTLFTEIRIIQHKSRATQLEREIADMKAKAAMLNARQPDPTPTPDPAFPVLPSRSDDKLEP